MSGLACGTCGHGICTCEPELGVQLWWHAYGGVREDLGGCWQLVVYGPGTAAPRIAAEIDPPRGCRYLGSWDHAPSDAEKDEVTPEEYRDEEQPMTAPSPAAAGLPAEDVERVARALWTEGLGPSMFGRKPWEELSPATQKVWRRLAAAALAEMRPTAAEEAVKRVEALIDPEAGMATGNGYDSTRLFEEKGIRAALAPVSHDADGGERR